MSEGFTRRRFVQTASAGTAILTMPAFLASCAKRDSAKVSGPPGAADSGAEAKQVAEWFGVDDSLINKVMTELAARGADKADLYFQHSRSNSITYNDGIISEATTGIDQGVGLRVVVGDRVGYTFTEDLTLESMLGAAQTAASIAQSSASTPPVEYSYHDPGDFYRIEVPWSEVGIAQKLPRIEQAVALTKGRDPAIKDVTARWMDSEERVLVATLDGAVYTDVRPMTRLWVSVTAEKGGKRQSNGSNISARQGFAWITDERLEMLTKQAVDRTMVLFDARRPPAGEMPVALMAGASGILLHEAVGHPLEADFNRKNISIYADQLNKRVAPDFVTIVDSGTLPGERGALNVDDEGSPSERTVVVDKGILRTYLHDYISAKHYGVPGTGSGRRQSFRHAPMPRMRCTYMENGPHKHDEIIASMKNGIIAETFTNGQVQIGAGDFTFYIKNGWLVENGKITSPIKDVNIIGNGPEALRRVTMVADNKKLDTGGWTCGKNGQSVPVSQGLPTVLVSKITVGGVNA
jgi:TldD protein